MDYPAVFEADRKAGGFVITLPDLPWGVTQAETEAEGLEMAQDLLALVLSEHIRKNLDLPSPGAARGRKVRRVRLPALQEAKVELYRQWRASGITKAEFARRIGIAKTNLDRLFNFKHHSRLDQMEAAFAALGKRLTIALEDAA